MQDLIDRQAAIDAIYKCTDIYINNLPTMVDKAEAYKALNEVPPAQPEIIRCKDCKWWGYDDDDGVVRVCHAAKHGYRSPNWDIMIYRKHKGDFYCSDAERREK